MKPADAGDEKLGTDALCGDELADEDLEDVAGGWCGHNAEHTGLRDRPQLRPDSPQFLP